MLWYGSYIEPWAVNKDVRCLVLSCPYGCLKLYTLLPGRPVQPNAIPTSLGRIKTRYKKYVQVHAKISAAVSDQTCCQSQLSELVQCSVSIIEVNMAYSAAPL